MKLIMMIIIFIVTKSKFAEDAEDDEMFGGIEGKNYKIFRTENCRYSIELI